MSIYRQALGGDFARLHPRIQERFGFGSRDGVASLGRGVMERIWRGPSFATPFLWIGAWRWIMFPEHGRDVPFTVRNYAFRDRFDRETVSWIRKFDLPRPRRFDAHMIYSRRRGCIVDYLGTHQHLAVDIDLSVDNRGGMRLRSGAQRFYEGLIGFCLPLAFSGVADVCEWYDDAAGRFRIDVRIENRRLGPLFGYRGWFQAEFVAADGPPSEIALARVERRE